MFRFSYHSIPNHLPDGLNEESVITIGITICDTLRQMLTNNILLYILYRVYIKSTHSNNINNVRKNEKFHLLLLLLRELNIIIPTKVQLRTS